MCRALIRRGCALRAVDNFSSGTRDTDFTVLDVDVSDFAAAKRACSGCGAIVHLAAFSSVPRSLADPAGAQRDTEQSTLALLQAAAAHGIKRLVLASSSSVYGDAPRQPVSEDSPAAPKSPYAQAKLASEVHLRQAAPVIDGVSLRFFNLYGPGQLPGSAYAAAIPTFADCLLRNAPITVFGDGSQTRDFLYVTDAVDAIIAALESPGRFDGAAINVASGQALTITALLDCFAQVEGAKLRVEHAPERRGDIRLSHADISRARDRLGFSPKVALRQGLKNYLDWLRARGSPCAE